MSEWSIWIIGTLIVIGFVVRQLIVKIGGAVVSDAGKNFLAGLIWKILTRK